MARILALMIPAFRTALIACFGTGSVTDRIDLFNIVCVPGLTDAATIATLQGHCRDRRAFLIVDSPDNETVTRCSARCATLTGADAPNAAVLFSMGEAPDPLQEGAFARFRRAASWPASTPAPTARARRVESPGRQRRRHQRRVGLAITMSDAENGLLNPHGVNCLRTLPGFGNVVWGARTLHGDNDRGSEWKYVPVRRMALFLEESLYRGTPVGGVRAERRAALGADPPEHRRLHAGPFPPRRLSGHAAARGLLRQVRQRTTTQPDIDLGIVNILVGFAPLKPAEFVVIRIQQVAGPAHA